jgi:lipopolysaccharide transport system ATP-binding protein
MSDDDVIIRAEGLGKRYAIGQAAERERYTALRDVLAANVRGVGRRIIDLARGRALPARPRTEAFWALKDVSFEIKRGEVVGVIGRNGAGKSTLLKVLSRITEPSEGRVGIRGRVASLLEVGTGFHPELTGRENVYLNGAILGMSRGEIRRKFDEIVQFAAVEQFIDTPVKRYSSGMQVRLAFSVAAHLEPEILVVDEVLAVGDAEFQKKCLGKMGEVSSREGRTVLFVSHQLGMVSRLCSRAIVLSGGEVDFDGPVNAAIERRLASMADRRVDERTVAGLENREIAVTRVETFSASGQAIDQLPWDQPFQIRVGLRVRGPVGGRLLGIAVDSHRGGRVTTWATDLAGLVAVGAERTEICLDVAPNILAPGAYSLAVAVTEASLAIIHQREGESPFAIVDTGSAMAAYTNIDYGVAFIPATWSSDASDRSPGAGRAPRALAG